MIGTIASANTGATPARRSERNRDHMLSPCAILLRQTEGQVFKFSLARGGTSRKIGTVRNEAAPNPLVYPRAHGLQIVTIRVTTETPISAANRCTRLFAGTAPAVGKQRIAAIAASGL